MVMLRRLLRGRRLRYIGSRYITPTRIRYIRTYIHQTQVHQTQVQRVKQEIGTSTNLPKYCKKVQTGIRYIMGNRKIVQQQYRNQVHQGIQDLGTSQKTGSRYIMKNRTQVHQKCSKAKNTAQLLICGGVRRPFAEVLGQVKLGQVRLSQLRLG